MTIQKRTISKKLKEQLNYNIPPEYITVYKFYPIENTIWSKNFSNSYVFYYTLNDYLIFNLINDGIIYSYRPESLLILENGLNDFSFSNHSPKNYNEILKKFDLKPFLINFFNYFSNIKKDYSYSLHFNILINKKDILFDFKINSSNYSFRINHLEDEEEINFYISKNFKTIYKKSYIENEFKNNSIEEIFNDYFISIEREDVFFKEDIIRSIYLTEVVNY
jgi:hypothetical protein